METLGSLSVGGPPARRDSLFRTSSTSKPMTGTATMVLVGEGLLGLDDPIERLLPELVTAGCYGGWTGRSFVLLEDQVRVLSHLLVRGPAPAQRRIRRLFLDRLARVIV